ADPGDREQVLEELALGRLREPVELERVLAHVQVRLEGHLSPALGEARGRRSHRDRVADAADLEHELVARARDRLAPEPRDHPAALSSGDASAWQIATASASEACCGVGGVRIPRMAITMRCTWAFSARP